MLYVTLEDAKTRAVKLFFHSSKSHGALNFGFKMGIINFFFFFSSCYFVVESARSRLQSSTEQCLLRVENSHTNSQQPSEDYHEIRDWLFAKKE